VSIVGDSEDAWKKLTHEK